jgi:hypothetical protein
MGVGESEGVEVTLMMAATEEEGADIVSGEKLVGSEAVVVVCWEVEIKLLVGRA